MTSLALSTHNIYNTFSFLYSTLPALHYLFHIAFKFPNHLIEEIFIASVDGLPGFKEAIKAIYPNTKVQRCIVHQIRNTLRFLNYKERKAFAQELKDVYRAHDAESGFDSLERLNKEYPEYSPALKSWYDNWNELSHFFEYP